MHSATPAKNIASNENGRTLTQDEVEFLIRFLDTDASRFSTFTSASKPAPEHSDESKDAQAPASA